MSNKRKLILPGDKGFKEGVKYPWHKLRNLLGAPIRQPEDTKIEIHGFFVRDSRIFPPIAIFKNCSFALMANTVPKIDNTPVPFTSVGEAHYYIKSLNLSFSEESKFRICGLCPDPGIANPMPDVMFATEDELKK